MKNDCWAYDAASNTWSSKAKFPGVKREDATAFAFLGKGYVGTGVDSLGLYKKDFWAYDTTSNSWTQIADLTGVGRNGAFAFATDSNGYVGTGVDAIAYYHVDFWQLKNVTSITETISEKTVVNIYPNPLRDIATISISNTNECVFTLYTLQGKEIQQLIVNGGKATFNKNNIAVGVYMYTLSQKNNKSVSGKLIISE